MSNSESQSQQKFRNKHALVFDTGALVFVHGNLSVELDGATQTDRIDLEDVSDSDFKTMMEAPNDFKVSTRKGSKKIERHEREPGIIPKNERGA